MTINQEFFNKFQSRTRLTQISRLVNDDVNIVFYHKNNYVPHDVLLTGGVHGDEQAGPYAILEFFEKFEFMFSDRFNFYTFPCVNSSGFVRDYLYNSKEENINRSFFEGSQVVEAKFVMDELVKLNKRFLFGMDFHEAGHYWSGKNGWYEHDGYYEVPSDPFFWETQKNVDLRVGHLMADAVRNRKYRMCDWDSFCGDDMINGVIYYPEGCHNESYAVGTSLDSYVNRLYSDHTFTTETPIMWQMDHRINVQVTLLISALQNIGKG